MSRMVHVLFNQTYYKRNRNVARK